LRKLGGLGCALLMLVVRLAGQVVAPVPAAVGATAAPVQAPQLSPEAAYEQAVRPLEIVRRSMENWSDVEVGAFAVAMKNSGIECLARKPEQFTGDDLISYAKLCSLGQKWAPMGVAAGRYIDSDDVKKPQLATAYGYKLESELHAQDLIGIVGIETAMLAGVPYDSIVDTATNEAMDYLRLTYMNDALGLMKLRQPLLLEALKSEKPLLARHVLYGDGLAFAALQQYAGQPDAAKATVAELDAALGKTLGPDDAIPVEGLRRQYGLLGRPLPELKYELSLQDVKEKPHINPDLGAATALLLFPEWCAQCVKMAPDIWDAMGRLGQNEVRVYGLVAEPLPDKAALLVAQMKPMGTPAVVTTAEVRPKTPSEMLLHTPTLVVPTETLERFAATDFPFLVVVDHAGIVRFAGAAPESVLQPGDFLDRVAAHVAVEWPRVKAAATR